MLEQELGTTLFEKRGRNVALTKYGKVFREYVQESLSILDSGVKKMKALTSETSGMIDLAYIYTLGSVFVPQLVGGFLNQHEGWDVEFHFHAGSTTDIIKGLKEEKYDLALCSGKEDEPEVVFIPVGMEKLVVVVPKDHELAGRGAITLAETVKYPHICFPKSCGLRLIIDDLFEKSSGMPEIAYEILEDNSMAGLWNCCNAGNTAFKKSGCGCIGNQRTFLRTVCLYGDNEEQVFSSYCKAFCRLCGEMLQRGGFQVSES